MIERVVVLSGPIASGKSSLSSSLVSKYGFESFSTGALISSMVEADEPTREELQERGRQLDTQQGGRWVANAVAKRVSALDEDPENLVIDAARNKEQVEALRNAYGTRVTHVHLTASDTILRERFQDRDRTADQILTFEEAKADTTEASAPELIRTADVVVDTDRCSQGDVVVRVASCLGLYGRGIETLVDVIVGGQYGSEGKGHIASHLAPEYDVLVRVGGPNAGHTVYEDPEPRVFHHLPSGTERAPNAIVLLGPGAVLNPDKLLKEISNCQLDSNRLFIDPRAMIIESEDIEEEQGPLREEIGSTAQGVGVATSRKILRSAADPEVRLAKHHDDLKPYVGCTLELLEQAFSASQKILLEGTQGTGLSVHHGQYPYVTSRDTTVSGCLAESGIAPSRVRRTIMVCRTYPIRVESPKDGDSGPMGIEIDWETVAERSGLPGEELKQNQHTSTTERNRRVSEFNWERVREAATLNGPTDIALTFADYISDENRRARRFEQLTSDTISFIEEVERVTSAPVSLVSTRFHFRSIIDRRKWM